MALSLTCDCGARFDAEDLLAGQEVACPECGEPTRAPAEAGPRVSLWALAALCLALIGALTPVGGVAAALVGLWALAVIRRRPEQLTGQGLAAAAVAIGLGGTLVTAALSYWPDLIPAGAWLRQRALAGQVDTSGSLQMVSRSGEVMLDRPSRDWGRAKRDRTDDPVVGELQQNADLLLVNVRRHAFVDVIRAANPHNIPLERYRELLETDLNPYRPPLVGDDTRNRRFGGWAGGNTPETGEFPPRFENYGQPREIAPLDGHKGKEWRLELPRGGQRWKFIVRAYRKQGARLGDPIHVIRAYTLASRFQENEEELVGILDTVRIPQ